jgi:transcriptional regulator with XRE-family HTH domain
MECPYCNGKGTVTAQENFGIGDLLRLHRRNTGLTLRDIEKSTGVSNAYISQLETGKIKSPGIEIVIKLCEMYGIDFNDLVGFMKGNPE